MVGSTTVKKTDLRTVKNIKNGGVTHLHPPVLKQRKPHIKMLWQ
jgi:hypothetical protein